MLFLSPCGHRGSFSDRGPVMGREALHHGHLIVENGSLKIGRRPLNATRFHLADAHGPRERAVPCFSGRRPLWNTFIGPQGGRRSLCVPWWIQGEADHRSPAPGGRRPWFWLLVPQCCSISCGRLVFRDPALASAVVLPALSACRASGRFTLVVTGDGLSSVPPWLRYGSSSAPVSTR